MMCAGLLGSIAAAGVDTSRLQAILDAKALEWNTSFSLAIFSNETGPIAVAAGFNDRKARTLMTTANRFPVGSVTKPFTTSLTMQAYESGLLDIDEPIYKYVDPVLQRLNGTTMQELWAPGNTSLWMNITARQLMGMRAGLPDYNDTWYHEVTLQDPSFDVTPFDILHLLSKHFVCKPGTCSLYASPSYELLGLALVSVHNLSRWEDLDQRDVVQASRYLTAAEKAQYTGLSFPGRGRCSLDPLIVHQYANMPYKWTPHGSAGQSVDNITYTDIRNNSCLNGWVCGNIASTPLDIARFHYHLHNGKIVNATSLRAMTRLGPMWDRQHAYGYGLMETWPPGGNTMKYDPSNATFTIGHAGDDYGSAAQLAGWNVRYNFGIAMGVNSYIGTNCSRPSLVYRSGAGYDDAMCELYDEALRIVTNASAPRLNCSLCGPSSASGAGCRSGHQPSSAPAAVAARRRAAAGGGSTTAVTCTWDI